MSTLIERLPYMSLTQFHTEISKEKIRRDKIRSFLDELIRKNDAFFFRVALDKNNGLYSYVKNNPYNVFCCILLHDADWIFAVFAKINPSFSIDFPVSFKKEISVYHPEKVMSTRQYKDYGKAL